MSGRNNDRGPTSALADFLQAPESTTAVTKSRAATFRDPPEAGPANVAQAEGDNGNGVSNADEDHEMAEEEDDEVSAPTAARQRTTRAATTAGFVSDKLERDCVRENYPAQLRIVERIVRDKCLPLQTSHPNDNIPNPTVVSVSKCLPFAPPNGVRYEKGDEKQLCEMTPIPLWEIDYRLLGGSQVPRLLPPMFHLGWPVGRDKLLELVQREFPELVLYTEADQKGEVLWDSIVYIPDGIIRDLNIPEELHECVQVSEVLHPDGTRQAALCVGDSRIGILRPNPGAIEQIAQRFFDGKDPQWYLDPWQWQWTRKARILSPEEARKWAADMNAREAALAGMAGIHEPHAM